MIKIRTSSSRYLLLGSSLIFGFFAFKNLCPISFLQFLFILKDKAVLSLFPFLVFLATIVATLIFGRIFCGWVCPIGVFQELIYRLPQWFKLKIPRLTKKIPPVFKLLPIVVLGIIGLGVIRFGQAIFCQFDPFAYFFGLSNSLVLLGGLVIILTISLFVFRPFCVFACPLAPFFSALASVCFWEIKKDKKRCNQCKICVQKCPTGAINKKLEIDEKNCFLCQDCLLGCPKKALSYQP